MVTRRTPPVDVKHQVQLKRDRNGLRAVQIEVIMKVNAAAERNLLSSES